VFGGGWGNLVVRWGGVKVTSREPIHKCVDQHQGTENPSGMTESRGWGAKKKKIESRI